MLAQYELFEHHEVAALVECLCCGQDVATRCRRPGHRVAPHRRDDDNTWCVAGGRGDGPGRMSGYNYVHEKRGKNKVVHQAAGISHAKCNRRVKITGGCLSGGKWRPVEYVYGTADEGWVKCPLCFGAAANG